jgi:hypothetical protein
MRLRIDTFPDREGYNEVEFIWNYTTPVNAGALTPSPCGEGYIRVEICTNGQV